MDRWKAGEEVQETIKTLVGEAHPHLVDIMDDIIVIFKEKASRKGGQPVLGKTSKAPALISLLGERDYQFVIELAADTWNQLDDTQKKALLDHQLCFIGGEEDEKTAEMKYYLTAPDISYFSDEVDRNGHWRPDLSEKEEEEESAESENLSLEDL
jgi:hypothetical protein